MITSQIGHPLETMFAGVGIGPALIDAHVSTYKLYYREIARQKTLLLPNAAEAVREAVIVCPFGYRYDQDGSLFSGTDGIF